jgi:DNA modification methylase
MKFNLMRGNCLDLMKEMPDNSIDLVLTDPPYGTTKCKWDTIIPLDSMWKELKRITKKNSAVLLFGQEPFSSLLRCSNLDNYKYDIYWQKERLTNIQQVKRRPGKVIESISVFYEEQCTYNPQMQIHDGPMRSNGTPTKTIGLLSDSKEKLIKPYKDNGLRYPLQIVSFQRDILTCNLHPTQKPVALLEYLIKTFSNKGNTVLDFTMGSGSTGVACANTERNFIGMELDQDYFDIAKKRIEDSVLNKHQAKNDTDTSKETTQ